MLHVRYTIPRSELKPCRSKYQSHWLHMVGFSICAICGHAQIHSAVCFPCHAQTFWGKPSVINLQPWKGKWHTWDKPPYAYTICVLLIRRKMWININTYMGNVVVFIFWNMTWNGLLCKGHSQITLYMHSYIWSKRNKNSLYIIYKNSKTY